MAFASTSAAASTIACCSRSISNIRSARAIAKGKGAAKAAVAGGQTSWLHSSRLASYAQEASEVSEQPPRIQATLFQPEPKKVANHLNRLMQGLEPPISPDLAIRMVTHKGSISANAPAELSQHNARLAFLGRRILRLYLSIFFHAHTSLLEQTRRQQQASDDTADAIAPSPESPSSTKLTESLLNDTLNTYSLGRFVATRWELEHNMRWMQMVDHRGRPSGLGKVSGQAVEAIMGGIFRQYGAAVALQVFNSRVLPFLDLPKALRGPSVQLAKAHTDLSPEAQAALRQQTDEVVEAEAKPQ